jgi:hypothetical protein
MRFMMLMIPRGYEKAAPGTVPDAKAVEAMMKYNEALQKADVLLTLDGLHPPSMGARVSFPGGKPKVTDGPFAEAKEVIGGYWMIEVKSREEAIEWAKRCPASENEVIEIRRCRRCRTSRPTSKKPPKASTRCRRAPGSASNRCLRGTVADVIVRRGLRSVICHTRTAGCSFG